MRPAHAQLIPDGILRRRRRSHQGLVAGCRPTLIEQRRSAWRGGRPPRINRFVAGERHAANGRHRGKSASRTFRGRVARNGRSATMSVLPQRMNCLPDRANRPSSASSSNAGPTLGAPAPRRNNRRATSLNLIVRIGAESRSAATASRAPACKTSSRAQILIIA